MLLNPVLALTHLPGRVHIYFVFTHDRADALAHPLLRQESRMRVYEIPRPHGGHTHVSGSGVTLRVAITVHYPRMTAHFFSEPRRAMSTKLHPSMHTAGRERTGGSLKTASLTIGECRVQNATLRYGLPSLSMERLTVWFGQEAPPGHWTHVLLWDSFRPRGAPTTWRSLPEEIHLNRDSLRTEHLRWIHDVGMTQVKNKPLRQILCIRPELSYWWMTLPSCHALEPDSPVYNAVRLRELERIVAESPKGYISIANGDRTSIRLIRSWGRDTGRKVVIYPKMEDRRARRSGSWKLKTKIWLLNAVPPLGALAGLVTTGISTGVKAKTATTPEPTDIVMVDYLAHLRRDTSTSSKFVSNYWGPLVDLVQSTGATQWLHLSANRARRRDVEEDLVMMEAWQSSPQARHSILQAQVTFRLRMRALRDYFRVVAMGLRTRGKRELLWDDRAGSSMWLAFRSQYRDDWYGMSAFHNCLVLNLLEQFFSKLPKAPIGIYLFENQPWEMALIHAWRTGGHGMLVGYVHSTIPFWSTRYFTDPRDLWSQKPPGGMPCPDHVAVNGPKARQALRKGGYPSERLTDVEAVRYPEGPSLEPTTSSPRDTLLIFGEYDWGSTTRIIDIVEQALDISGFSGPVVFRAHPAMTPRWEQLPSRYTIDSHLSSHDALNDASIVVCGAVSSVAIEALRLGKPTYLVADGRTFASSPAEEFEPSWVFNSESLAAALRIRRREKRICSTPGLLDYFWLGIDLQRWRALLQSGSTGHAEGAGK